MFKGKIEFSFDLSLILAIAGLVVGIVALFV